MRFLPGVAILDDGENPGRIALGGFPAEMSNIQLDGGDVASTGVGTESGRMIALQEVPMVNIERVEVTKVPTPDMPASGLGGSLNLVTKSLLGTRRAYLDYRVYMAFNNKEGLSFDGGNKQPVPQLSPSAKQPSFDVSLVVPVSKRLAFSAGVSRTWRQRPADGTLNESALWNLKSVDLFGNPKDIALADMQSRQTAQITTTENLQAGVELKVSRNASLAFNIRYRESSAERANSVLTVRAFSSTSVSSANAYNPEGNGSYTKNVGSSSGAFEMGRGSPLNYEETTDNTHMTLRYKQRSAGWNIDGQAVYSKANRERTSIGKGYFAGYVATISGLNVRGDGIDEGDSILPNTYTVSVKSTGAAVNPYDGENYNLGNVRQEWGMYKTDLLSGRVDVERKFSPWFSFKAGAAYNRQEKDDVRTPLTYTFDGDSRGKRVGDYDFVDESIDVRINGQPIRWISPVKLYNAFLEHPEWFPMTNTTIQYRAQNSKRLIEDISAAYLRFDLKLFRNRLSLTGGLRYEKTKLDGWSMKNDMTAIYAKDENGERIKDPVTDAWILVTNDPAEQYRLRWQERGHHDGQNYDGFYPSLNATYAITGNLLLRAAYARTIGRPDVRYVVDGIQMPEYDEADEERARTIRTGNPGLEPWTANSFHLSLDSYHFKGGFGSVGVYRKYVTNFFAERTRPLTAEWLERYGIAESDIAYFLANGYAWRRYENVGDGHLTGLELSYRQDLLFLPRWLQKTQVWVNYTHLKVGGQNAEDFTGFSPDALSCGINYIGPRFSLQLNCAYQAETKKSLVANTPGTSGSIYTPDRTYNYQASYTRYGISAEYSFSRAFRVYMNWTDIAAKDSYVYRRAADTPAYAQKYQRVVTPSYIMVGVKGRF